VRDHGRIRDDVLPATSPPTSRLFPEIGGDAAATPEDAIRVLADDGDLPPFSLDRIVKVADDIEQMGKQSLPPRKEPRSGTLAR